MALRLVDLSFPIYDRMPTYAVSPTTVVVPHMCITDAGFNMHQLVLGTHLGTHVDAPYHFIQEGKTVDQLDLRKSIGRAAVVDVTGRPSKHEICPGDLEPYADAVARCRRIILRTGWDMHFGSPEYLTEHPAVTKEACAWMVEQGVVCLAMDLPSTHPEDPGDTHRMLLGVEMVLVECLRGLESLEEAEVVLIALPIAIRGSDGAFCRVIAIDGDVAALAETLDPMSV